MKQVRKKSRAERARLIALEQRRILAREKNPPPPRPRPPEPPAPPGPDVASMVESVVGCKWSLHALNCIRRGINRPGGIIRATDGLSTKVLTERLDKMVRFGILNKRSYPEVPPRVEYAFSPFGARILAILDDIESLKRDVAAGRL